MNINVNIILLITSFFYILLITYIYFSKKRIRLIENRVYSVIIITNIVGILLDFLGILVNLHLPSDSLFRLIVVKAYLIYLLAFPMLLTIYMFLSSSKREDDDKFNVKKFQKNLFLNIGLIFVISIIIMVLLPINYYNNGNIVYVFGPSTTFLYIVAAICILVWIFYIIKNFKTLIKIRYIPIIAYVIIGAPIVLVQMVNPGLLLMTAMESFITVLMFFTIENPDLKLIQELNIARDQADKANEAKTEFLSSMSHEIRTPLNAIVGFSQSLSEQNLPENVKEDVKDILTASDSLLEIVNGVLDISKIEANKLEIINTKYNFRKIFDELVLLTKGRLGDKPLDFRVQYDDSIPTMLYGDYVRLKQIILNLLTNAVKYTPSGHVEFKISSVIKGDACRLIISVEDTGIGIEKEKIDKLFTKFERFDAGKHRTIEGTGLGLAITKKLIELMNGQIVVQSIYGKGSKFTVAIDQKVVETPTIVSDNVENKTENFDVSNCKILVVDDNEINLKVAARLLKNYDIQVDTVLSGQECLDKINNGEKYDLIFMDDMMPKMTGVETFHLLKQNENFNIPTIALTANAISGMKEKYLKDGFNDYLPKPIDRSELTRVIKKFLVKTDNL